MVASVRILFMLPISCDPFDKRNLNRIKPGCLRRRGPASVLRTSGRYGELRSEEHTSELQSRFDLVCRLLLEKKNHHVRIVFPLALLSQLSCDLGASASLRWVCLQ